VLGKFFKHNVKIQVVPLLYVAGGWLLLCALLPILISNAPPDIGMIVKSTLSGATGWAFAFGFLLAPCCNFTRYFIRNNESYLYNTIPVKPYQLMLARMFSAYICVIMGLLVVLFSQALIMQDYTIITNFFREFSEIFTKNSGFNDAISTLCGFIWLLSIPFWFFSFSVFEGSIPMLFNWQKWQRAVLLVFIVVAIFFYAFFMIRAFVIPVVEVIEVIENEAIITAEISQQATIISETYEYGARELTGIIIHTATSVVTAAVMWILGERILRKHINLQ
jgi:hypothetical protein